MPAGHEILAFVDEHHQIELCVQRLSLRTNLGQAIARSVDELEAFLRAIAFPGHGACARSRSWPELARRLTARCPGLQDTRLGRDPGHSPYCNP